jgi:hypothetical protein
MSRNEYVLFSIVCWGIIIALIPATLRSIVRILALFAWLGILLYRRTFNRFPKVPEKPGMHLVLVKPLPEKTITRS